MSDRNGNATALLRAVGLCKRYPAGDGELTVFEGLDLEVRRGERVAVTGESGSGKSTLLHLLGLLERPTAGAVYCEGVELTALPEDDLARFRNRRIGFVWQMSTLLPDFTALENVMMPLLIRGSNRSDAGPVAARLLEEVGLSRRAAHRGGELSGGEQQRVVLARALAGEPQILLADEPTGNLDERTGVRIMELMEKIHESHGLATVYVTHHPGFAMRAHRILELESGALHPQRVEKRVAGSTRAGQEAD
jgi:lipoprotein-releasing system ATP-binding protein